MYSTFPRYSCVPQERIELEGGVVDGGSICSGNVHTPRPTIPIIHHQGSSFKSKAVYLTTIEKDSWSWLRPLARLL